MSSLVQSLSITIPTIQIQHKRVLQYIYIYQLTGIDDLHANCI